jgi:hypothetical protein
VRAVIIADPFLASVEQLVPFGDQQLPILRITLGNTGEGQLAPACRDTLPEEGFAALPFRRGRPFPNVEDQRAIGSQCLGERREDGAAARVINDVIEDAFAVVYTFSMVRLVLTND